jgi:hypothetical protein
VTVTCSGTTTDQNGTTGYGTVNDKGNNYNILAGASVTGTSLGMQYGNDGLRPENSGVLNNFGTITGAMAASSAVLMPPSTTLVRSRVQVRTALALAIEEPRSLLIPATSPVYRKASRCKTAM